MSAITYVALESLMPGHTRGSVQSIVLPMARIDRDIRSVRYVHKSLSGARDTWLHNIERYYDLETAHIDETSPIITPDHVREFLDSALGGQTFIIDLHGTLDQPHQAFGAELDSNAYRERRIGTMNVFTYSFRIQIIDYVDAEDGPLPPDEG